MKYNTIKELYTLMDDDRSDVENIIDNIGNDDFESGNYRFIKESKTLDVAIEQYENDEYMLGCFNSWFISDILDIDEDVIKAMQDTEAYEAIGKLIISLGKVENMIEEYINTDGYGSVFGSYDGDYEEIKLDGIDYIQLRVN